jgi:hypothetical protein
LFIPLYSNKIKLHLFGTDFVDTNAKIDINSEGKQMKSLAVLLFLLASSLSFAQGLIFSSVTEKPKVLMLERVNPWSGESYMAHVEENPLSMVKVVFIGDQLLKLQKHLLKSESSRIFCDGDFSLANDYHGSQFFALSTVSVCIDEEGWVVAHSFGKELSPEQVHRKAAELSKSIKKKDMGGAIYEASGSKVNLGNSESSKKQLNGSTRE